MGRRIAVVTVFARAESQERAEEMRRFYGDNYSILYRPEGDQHAQQYPYALVFDPFGKIAEAEKALW
jgi:hypothetical protein